jgi:hypothetical protein
MAPTTTVHGTAKDMSHDQTDLGTAQYSFLSLLIFRGLERPQQKALNWTPIECFKQRLEFPINNNPCSKPHHAQQQVKDAKRKNAEG